MHFYWVTRCVVLQSVNTLVRQNQNFLHNTVVSYRQPMQFLKYMIDMDMKTCASYKPGGRVSFSLELFTSHWKPVV